MVERVVIEVEGEAEIAVEVEVVVVRRRRRRRRRRSCVHFYLRLLLLLHYTLRLLRHLPLLAHAQDPYRESLQVAESHADACNTVILNPTRRQSPIEQTVNPQKVRIIVKHLEAEFARCDREVFLPSCADCGVVGDDVGSDMMLLAREKRNDQA